MFESNVYRGSALVLASKLCTTTSDLIIQRVCHGRPEQDSGLVTDANGVDRRKPPRSVEIVGRYRRRRHGRSLRARDARLHRDVAIKVLPDSFAADPERRARFEREAQAVAALSHPNVIAVFDIGES